MSDEKWIVSDKEHLGGKPRVQGTRTSVAFLLGCLASGMSVAEIRRCLSDLDRERRAGRVARTGARKGSGGGVRILLDENMPRKFGSARYS